MKMKDENEKMKINTLWMGDQQQMENICLQ